MISRLEIIPRTSQTANYEVVVNGAVFRAEDGAYGSVTSRPGQTVITGSIPASVRAHKFLVRHSGPLKFQIRGPVTKQVEEDVEGFSPTITRQGAGMPGVPGGAVPGGQPGAGPPLKAPAFGVPGRDSIPNARVKRGMPFAGTLLAGKTAIRGSRVGGLLQWQANQNPGMELPVKAVISANNPERPIEAIKRVARSSRAQVSLSGLNAPGLGAHGGNQEAGTVVTFRVAGQQVEKLEEIEGATFYLEGSVAAPVGNTGVPVGGDGHVQNGSTGGGRGAGSGGGPATGPGPNGASPNGEAAQPKSKDRIISGIPDAFLGAGLFVAGTAALVATSRSVQGDDG